MHGRRPKRALHSSWRTSRERYRTQRAVGGPDVLHLVRGRPLERRAAGVEFGVEIGEYRGVGPTARLKCRVETVSTGEERLKSTQTGPSQVGMKIDGRLTCPDRRNRSDPWKRGRSPEWKRCYFLLTPTSTALWRNKYPFPVWPRMIFRSATILRLLVILVGIFVHG
jgi:hypothetical protein